MKLIIAGSRSYNHFTDSSLARLAISEEVLAMEIVVDEIVSGGALGADEIGERWAREHRIPIRQFLADWDKHGKGAGPIRNAAMADYADSLLVICWDGRSRGTANMIKNMRDRGKPVRIMGA